MGKELTGNVAAMVHTFTTARALEVLGDAIRTLGNSRQSRTGVRAADVVAVSDAVRGLVRALGLDRVLTVGSSIVLPNDRDGYVVVARVGRSLTPLRRWCAARVGVPS